MILVPFLMGTATAKTLKIGTMSPLTGPYAADGNDIVNGVKAAVAVVEAEGGIPGFDKIEVHPPGYGLRSAPGRGGRQQIDQ